MQLFKMVRYTKIKKEKEGYIGWNGYKMGVGKVFVFHVIFLIACREGAAQQNMVSAPPHSPDKSVNLPQLSPYQVKMFHPVINNVKGI